MKLILPQPEQIIATAARYLVDGGEKDAASLLLTCSLEFEQFTQYKHGRITAKVTVRCPRVICDMANTVAAYYADMCVDESDKTRACVANIESIKNSIKAAMPSTIKDVDLDFRVQLVDLTEDWKSELEEIARGKTVHNQCVDSERILVWNNHRFRSQSEIRIAIALESAKVMFFPNCKARLGISKRENREPDFLICHKGKLGILEVDGEPYHPPTRTVEDHERDRLFLAHGIKLVQHFDAGECFENADGVVKKFLYLLDKQ